jgi:hypothetical protein
MAGRVAAVAQHISVYHRFLLCRLSILQVLAVLDLRVDASLLEAGLARELVNR